MAPRTAPTRDRINRQARPHPLLTRLAVFASWISRSDWHPEPGDTVYPVSTGRPVFLFEHRFMPGEVAVEAQAAGLSAVYGRDGSDVAVWAFERTAL